MLHIPDGCFEITPATERPDELYYAPQARERRNPQHIGIVEVEHTFFGILGEKRVQHGPGLRTVLRERVSLLYILGALPAGKRFLVKRNVTNEVEGVKI